MGNLLVLWGIAQLVERLVRKSLGDCGLKRSYVDKAGQIFSIDVILG
jgi:hypothetical protein